MSEDAIREDLRALAKQTADHLHTLSKETANNSERWAVHERDCGIRYNDLRRDLRDLMRFVKWLVVSMIMLCGIVVGKGAVPWDFLAAIIK